MRQKGEKLNLFGMLFVLAYSLIIIYFIVGEILGIPEDLIGERKMQQFDSQWTVVSGDDIYETAFPKTINFPEEQRITIETVLPQDQRLNNTWLRFWNKGLDIKAYVDDELRYTYTTKDTRIFGKSSPYGFIFLPLQEGDQGKTLHMELESIDSSIRFETMYIGDRFTLIASAMQTKMLEIMVAVVLLLTGICSLLASIMVKVLAKISNKLKYISYTVIIAAFWILTNSSIRQFYFPNLSTVRDLAYMLVGILPIAIMLYINDLQNKRYDKVYKVAISASFALYFVMNAVYMLGYYSLADLMLLSDTSILIATVLFVVTFAKDYLSGAVREYWLSAIGLAGLVFASLIQLLCFVVLEDNFYNGILVEFGLFFCLTMAVVNMVKEIIDINTEKNEALRAGNAKAQFLANMSHEIRTPINAVLGMNEMILREEKDEQVKGYAYNIQVAGKSLLGLINDILDFSKIDSGKMEIVEIDYPIVDLLQATYQMIYVRAEDKGLKLEYECNPQLPRIVYGDEVRIRQVMINFLTNAVKYTDKGTVSLNMDYEQVNEQTILLRIAVQDTGKGIREQEKEMLFQAFQRVDETKNRNIEGTGLGLHITQELVQLMGGRIEVESTYGKGSTFTVFIPQKVVDAQPIGKQNFSQTSVSARVVYKPKLYAPHARVLVVDDMPMNLAVFKGLLKKSDIQIDTAENGEECLEKIVEKEYHMIFLDHLMPKLDGIETRAKMNELTDNKNKNTPVIMLTANALSGAKEEYLQVGFDDYLSKPMDCKQLEEMIMRYLPEDLWVEKIDS